LFDAGSRSATNAGLFHYTTRATQDKETNSIADIGAHYIALNSSGQPWDDDGDGIPDYIEDSNGNGWWDSDEGRWTSDDPDYDGVPTYQEISDGTDPLNPADVRHKLLGYWVFDSTAFQGTATPPQVPIFHDNLGSNLGFHSYTATYSTASRLGYLDVETNLTANICARNGTVRFWFKPNWASGSGSAPSWSPLICLGWVHPGVVTNGWNISFGANASTLRFVNEQTPYDQDNDWPISFASGRWYQIAVAYTPTNIAAYVNGQLIGVGANQPYVVGGATLRQSGTVFINGQSNLSAHSGWVWATRLLAIQATVR
jgi:hypothetical protein